MRLRTLGILGGIFLAAALVLGTFGTAMAQTPGSGWGPGTMGGGMMGGYGGGSGGGPDGMMGGWWGGAPNGQEKVTADQAKTIAQKWLDANQPGSTPGDQPDAFYGYYTLHTLKDGQITGMLSVNAYTGQVWYHTWHGAFIGMESEE